jgi:hypothetical protein
MPTKNFLFIFFIITDSFLIVFLLIAHSSFVWYAVCMTIQQTIDIPADRRLHVDLPETTPTGYAEVQITITFVPAPKKEEPKLFTAKVPADPRPVTLVPIHVCHTLDEARSDAARKSTPEAREEFCRVMQETYGALEHSKAWGQGVDVVAEIRKMRDEWGAPWAEALERNSPQEQAAPHE